MYHRVEARPDNPRPMARRSGPGADRRGFTDTAALTAAGLCAIGRPSNHGGAELLGQLLAKWPADRGIIVVGENDENRAGLEGAISVSRKLARSLRRRVPYAIPPAKAKDVRAWLTADSRRETDWRERGNELLRFLDANLTEVDNAEQPTKEVPEILVEPDEHRVDDQACAAVGRLTEIYQRGGILVHVVEQAEEPEDDAVVRSAAGSVSIRLLPKPLLREQLTACARWVAWRGRGETAQKVHTHPPEWSVSAVHARGNWPSVRQLDAVLTHPVLLPNGTLLSENGYHKNSRLLLRMPHRSKLSVPNRPSRFEVAARWRSLAGSSQTSHSKRLTIGRRGSRVSSRP